MADRPLLRQVKKFVNFHLYDKQAFGAFTGQDYAAWSAFVYTLELIPFDAVAESRATDALCSLVRACQKHDDVYAVFQKSIPAVLDWQFESSIWFRVTPQFTADGKPRFFAPLGERVCSHLKSKPSKKHAGMFDCRDCKTTWAPEAA